MTCIPQLQLIRSLVGSKVYAVLGMLQRFIVLGRPSVSVRTFHVRAVRPSVRQLKLVRCGRSVLAQTSNSCARSSARDLSIRE